MQGSFVYVRALIATAVVATASTFLTPRTVEAQAPSGSYQNSCRSITYNKGGVLQADCRTMNNTWKRSSLRVANCRNGDIANRDGRLVCANNGPGRYDNSRPGTWPGRPSDTRPSNRPGNRGQRGHDQRNDRGKPGQYDNRNNRNSGIVLYTSTRWNGRRMGIHSDYMNLEKTGFNDKAASIQIVGRGTWRLCSEKNYGGRCVNVSSDVRDLNTIGLRNRVSSIRRIR